jgi:hypothetical protein
MMRVLAIAPLSLLLVAIGAQASTVTVDPPPSGSASFAVSMTNNGDGIVSQPLFSIPPISSGIGALSVAEPCQLLAGPLDPIWELRAPSLASGESHTCEVTFTRTALSPINSFAWRPSPGAASTDVTLTPNIWAFGEFDDPSISVEPVQPLPFAGATEALFRITVTNPGNATLVDIEFGGCQFVSSDMVTMDTDFPGGCAVATQPHFLCFGGHVDFGAAVPDVAAHSQSSCLVRARRAAGLVADSGWPFDLYFDRDAPTANGYVLGDSNPDNNSAYAAVEFFNVGHAIPVGRTGVFLGLAIAFFSLALTRIRRERQVSTHGVSS